MGKRIYRRELTEIKKDSPVNREAKKKMSGILAKVKRHYSALVDAVNHLKPTAVEEDIKVVCTDGRKLFYNPENLMKCEWEDCIVYEILHIIVHGLLGHFEKGSDYDNLKMAWDVMDLQVLDTLTEAGVKLDRTLSGSAICLLRGSMPYMDDLKEVKSGFSLYYKARRDTSLQKKIKGKIAYTRKVYPEFFDDHSTWALPLMKVDIKKSQEDGMPDENGNNGWIDISAAISGLGKSAFRNGIPMELQNAIARAIKKSGIKAWGDRSGGITGEEIESGEESILSYNEIIDDVVSFSETCKEEDELDPAIYEYGLSMYGDVPLIEPLEHKFEYEINSVVIAVDTSGSCAEYLGSFWTETLEIFKELEKRGKIGRIHYIECDADICFEKEYEGSAELYEASNRRHRFTGMGGTDFRPVFKKAESYEQNLETIDFLIYFSDGEGEFPEKDPGYPVYFVLPNAEYLSSDDEEERPEWVKAMVLDKVPAT